MGRPAMVGCKSETGSSSASIFDSTSRGASVTGGSVIATGDRDGPADGNNVASGKLMLLGASVSEIGAADGYPEGVSLVIFGITGAVVGEIVGIMVLVIGLVTYGPQLRHVSRHRLKASLSG